MQCWLSNNHKNIEPYIFGEISQIATKWEERCLLVVPDPITFHQEKALIDYIGESGLFNVQVLSFNRLAYGILEEVGGLKKEAINDYGKMMLIQRLMTLEKQNLQLFNRKYIGQGLLKEINDLLRELKTWQVSWDFIKQVANKTADEGFQKKLMDVALIYEKTEAYLQDHYLDEVDVLKLATQCIQDSIKVKHAIVYFHGFDSYNGSEWLMIQSMMQQAKKVGMGIVIHDYEKLNDGYSGIGIDTYAKLEKACKENKINLEIRQIEPLENLAKEPSLGSRFFCESAQPLTRSESNIQFHEKQNPHEEIIQIANSMIALVRDKDYRWKDFLIVLGEEKAYKKTCEIIFDEYGIPCFFDFKRSIKPYPLVRFLMSLIDMALYHFQLKDTFTYLKCGYHHYSSEEIESLENYALSFGIKSYKWKRPFIRKGVTDEVHEAIRQEILPKLLEIEKLNRVSTAKEKTEIILNLMQTLKVDELINKDTIQLKKEKYHEKAYEQSQVWNSVMDILHQTITISGEIPVELKEYKEMVLTGIESYDLSIIPPTEDCVMVSSLGRIVPASHRVIYVTGLNEGIVPMNKEIKGLFFNEEREILQSFGAQLIDQNYHLEKEKRDFIQLLESYTCHLFLSYSLSDVQGKPLRPSSYVERVKFLLANFKLLPDSITEPSFSEALKPAVYQLGIQLRLADEGKSITFYEQQFLYWLSVNRKSDYDLLMKGVSEENKVTIKNNQQLKKLYPEPLTFSPYHIEAFKSCPFKYFVEQALRPKERSNYEVDIKNIGSIYHLTLDEMVKLMIENPEMIHQPLSFWESQISEKAKWAIDRIDEEKQVFQENYRNQFVQNRIIETVTKSAMQVVNQIKMSQFKPSYNEMGFGIPGEPMQAITLNTKEGKSIVIQGRIDRIDILEVEDKMYLNIVDYKSSNKTIDLSGALQGINIQLLIYLNAVLNYNADCFEKELKFGGVFYFKVDDIFVDGEKIQEQDRYDFWIKQYALEGYTTDNIEVVKKMDENLELSKEAKTIQSIKLKNDDEWTSTAKVLDKKKVAVLLKKIEEIVIHAAQQIMDGYVAIEPYLYQDKKPCDYCDYRSICQFDDSMAGNSYRRIHKVKDKDLLVQLEEVKDEMDT